MLTLTDLFCGAGGSSTGAINVPGVRVRMAANHTRHAIDTHQANHPDTDHDCADLSQVEPRRYPTTDILWASPECTNHSNAKGVARDHGEWDNGLFAADGTNETAIRSRATMWDVPRFAEVHQYRAIIVENVVESRWWGPKSNRGAVHDAWLATMKAWNYAHQSVYLNSMHAAAYGQGAAQSRDRKYDIFWRPGDQAPDFDKWLRPVADCPTHGRVRAIQGWKTTKLCNPLKPWGKFGARNQYVWRCPQTSCRNQVVEPAVRAAAEIVDWSLPATVISERAERRMKALEPATMRRIRAGFEQFHRPYLVPVEGRDGKQPFPVDHPMRTCSTRNETGLALPPYMVELRGGSSSHRAVTEPLATVCAGGNHHGVVTAPDMILPYYSSTTAAQEAHHPLPTVTTVERCAALYGGSVTRAEDMRFRMLEPEEYQAAMEFPADYILTPNDKRTKVEMLGNAVTPNAARDLVAMVTEALTGQDLEPAAR
ncbi:DNA cytosine methyltransferase [Streptomyces sp. NPDC051561]|uniref:DNA cytosine methyltransferase n=1 Tax=Streptomyces sp. NPDC051561 TaxID=3365658 RepID=UPI0037A2706D